MPSVCCVGYGGMLCDLDETPVRTCVLRSPLIPDTFNWTCMYVSYELSSNDVKLTVDLLADDIVNVSYILSASESEIWIPNPNLTSSISVQLAASRYLVSTEDYEHAAVSNVHFLPCPAHTGMDCYKCKKKLDNLKRCVRTTLVKSHN